MERVVIAVAAVLLLLPVRSAAQSPTAELYPVLFVHGFCSNAETWLTMTASLRTVSPSRYGTVVTPLSAGLTFPAQDPGRRIFTIDFRGQNGSFDPRDVAQVPIAAKAVELKQVIDEIKRITGRSKVIVIGYSMGGLVARWYVQRGAGATPYANDVAAVATIDTPHLGTNLAVFDERALEFDAFLQCLLLPSTNRAELAPGSTALTTLNGSPLGADTPIASIASWQTEFNPRTDGVVTYESQNLLSVYPQLANTVVFQLDNPITLGIQQILHLLVNQLPSTIGLVNTVVSAVDRLQGSTPAPPPVGAPGAPQLTATTAGGQVTISWTPAATGGAPTSYVLRGTFQTVSPSPLPPPAVPFDLPVGAATSIAVPPVLRGSFTVRVIAVNAAGESPASNEVAFTLPPGQ